MSRYVTVTLLFAGLAALVGAQGPRDGISADEQARLLAQNRKLLQATVDGSLELTEKASALDRAGTCTRLLKDWSKVVADAAQAGDAARAREMGDHLNRVADIGVAANFKIARAKIQPGSPMEGELFRQRDLARDELLSVEKALDTREFEPLRKSIAEVRGRIVESASRDK